MKIADRAAAFAAAFLTASVGAAHADESADPSGCRGAMSVVEAVFAALDQRRIDGLEDLFAPGATVVHDNGREADVRQTAQATLAAPDWPPRQRALSRWRATCLGADVALVTLRNDVTFTPAQGGAFSRAYQESWILVRGKAGWRAAHGHYTRVDGR
jgi:hypothetical protein